MSKAALTVLVAAKLHKNQLERHLELFEHIPEVRRVLVVRKEPLAKRLSKIENHPFRGGPRPLEAARMMSAINSLIKSEQVDWVLGFNPVPWGTVASLPAKWAGVSTCLSLIGKDYLQVQTPWGAPFLQAIRRADAVTVTGRKMLDGLVERGVERSKIHVLPHSVDIERFRPSSTPPRYDLVAVGQLIHRKRMDVTLDALALLRGRGRTLRFAILGAGEGEAKLRDQVRRLDLESQVEFLGYRDDVEEIVRSARIFCLVSEWEGVPFAMMEAMASGLVPVVTDVGTITDWIRDGENGRIVPVGDPSALADALDELLSHDGAELNRLADATKKDRNALGFEHGALVWRRVLGLS